MLTNIVRRVVNSCVSHVYFCNKNHVSVIAVQIFDKMLLKNGCHG